MKRQSTAAGNIEEPSKVNGELPMPKKEGWMRGVGPFSGTDDIKLRQVPMTKDAEGRKDISKVTDRNSEGPAANDGFSAPLTKPKD